MSVQLHEALTDRKNRDTFTGGLYDSAFLLAEAAYGHGPRPLQEQSHLVEPNLDYQWDLILEGLKTSRPEDFYNSSLTPEAQARFRAPTIGVATHGLSRKELLTEYAVAYTSRVLGSWASDSYAKGQPITFAIPGLGTEAAFLSLERFSSVKDRVFPHYRYEYIALKRGIKPRVLMAQHRGSISDEFSHGHQLPNHPSSAEANIATGSSWIGPHGYTAVGVALEHMLIAEISKRRGLPLPPDYNPQSIVHWYTGNGGMAHPETLGALNVLGRYKPRIILTILDNKFAISTPNSEEYADGDPLALAHGLSRHGVHIASVDGSNMVDLFNTSREVIQIARGGTPVIYHIRNVARMKSHSATDDDERYLTSEEQNDLRRTDPIPHLSEYLIQNGVANERDLDAIRKSIEKYIFDEAQSVMEEPLFPVTDVHNYTYAHEPESYGPVIWTQQAWQTERMAQMDHLKSSRDNGELAGVQFITRYDDDPDQPMVLFKEAINSVLGQEMMEDPNLILMGEDDADFSVDKYGNGGIIKMFNDKISGWLQANKGLALNEADIDTMYEGAQLIDAGRGREVNPIIFAAVRSVIQGKGNVFTMFGGLQMLVGETNVFNSTLDEHAIAALTAGLGLGDRVTAGGVFQFQQYADAGYDQWANNIASMNWRGYGKFGPRVFYFVQGMSRLGGKAGPGHGGAGAIDWVKHPGLLSVFPAHTREVPGLLRETIRLARLGQPMAFVVPISLLGGDRQRWQPRGHIPIGEAELYRDGGHNSVAVIAWSNNVLLADKAIQDLEKEKGIKTTLINARTLGPAADMRFLTERIRQHHGNVIIFEAEAYTGSAGGDLARRLNSACADCLEHPIEVLSAYDVWTPANKHNEDYVLPQAAQLAEAIERSHRY